MPNLHVIQHNRDEDLGRIKQWAQERGIEPTIHFPLSGSALPQLVHSDKLIILGGAQNVGDSVLRPEQQLLQHCITQDIAVLGICLGSQLLADALGGTISKLSLQELGWKKIQLDKCLPEEAKLAAFLTATDVFLWHDYQFSIPSGALSLGETEQCKQQGFELGKHVGLQFHPEWLPAQLDTFAKQNNWPENTIEQSPEAIRQLEISLFSLLDSWWLQ